MKLLQASAVGILLLSLLSLSSCGTAKRFSLDLSVAATSPFLVIYGGSTDAVTDVQEATEALDMGPFTQVVAFPFYFLYHGVKHALYSIIHVVDAPLCVFYGAAELHPDGPEIRPLDYYEVPWISDRPAVVTDFESGESTGR